MTEETNGNGTPQEETQEELASALAEVVELPEAPISWNIRYYAEGYECQLTMRGFTANSLLPRTAKAIKWLEAQGYTPRLPRGNGSAPAPASNGGGVVPMCPTHNKPMKPSKQKSGGWYCTEKIAEDDGTGRPVYCKQTVK